MIELRWKKLAVENLGMPPSSHPIQFGERDFRILQIRYDIRQRDAHACQRCGVSEDALPRALHVHHIDGNKMNNADSNLIALCPRCHAQIRRDATL